MKDKDGLAASYQTLAEINFNLKDLVHAKEFARKSLQLAQEINARQIKKDCYKVLSEITATEGSYKQAYEHRLSYERIYDSLYNSDKARQVVNMEAIFENDKIAHEIDLLTQKNEAQGQNLKQQGQIRNLAFGAIVLLFIAVILLLNRYRIKQKTELLLNQQKIDTDNKNKKLEELSERLEKSLEEKNVLLKEMHHRVKNNLQIISSLLSLQSESITDEKAIQAIQDGQNRVRSMALIHQQLYLKENLTTIHFSEYVSKLAGSLIQSYKKPGKKIECIVEGATIELDVDKAIPLGIIINELITNSLKHAFHDREHGNIEVQITRSEKEGLAITIADDGGGFSQEFFAIDKVPSLGLKLIRSLTQQLDGRIAFFSDGGTKVKLQFSN